ncbi:DnaJ C-terminal domain-containing protein [Neosynechococcus sphagnicola]|uniref:DnaJ C-terminal domain-containing protein n=1 Tax=Neosynechococcus sphagnicola TaxID=1501145 RepID=UPI0030842935
MRLEDGRSLEVNMPPGMVSGQRIRLKGQGVNGGDLYLKIDVAPHSFFKLETWDIQCQLPITPSEAVLGAQVEVPTLDGLVKMTIPPGIRSGQRLRLANKGYPNEGEGQRSPSEHRGDQIVELQIVTPRELDPQERELYEKLRRLETFNPRLGLLG